MIAAAAPAAFVTVPPSDCLIHFGDLLLSGEGVDVKFVVVGDEINAHRCVLAARSSVFKAQFFGAMEEGAAWWPCVVEVTDIKADVFRNLLHYIYIESLRGMAEWDESIIMAQHLFVMADKYNIGRLKILCEEILCCHMDVRTVASTLALAEQHGSSRLEEKSVEFLKLPGVVDIILSEDFEHMIKNNPSLLKSSSQDLDVVDGEWYDVLL